MATTVVAGPKTTAPVVSRKELAEKQAQAMAKRAGQRMQGGEYTWITLEELDRKYGLSAEGE